MAPATEKSDVPANVNLGSDRFFLAAFAFAIWAVPAGFGEDGEGDLKDFDAVFAEADELEKTRVVEGGADAMGDINGSIRPRNGVERWTAREGSRERSR